MKAAQPASEELKAKIRNWWAGAPMTYGEDHGRATYHRPDGSTETVELGSQRFFELADEVFYRWNRPIHDVTGNFGRIFDYQRYGATRSKVLEIGCGMGCMAMNWAQHGADMTAIDLNPVAIEQTRRRFEVFGLKGDIREADSEALPLADGQFDFAYSWGVLHHTPNIRRAIQEVRRTLKPGGQLGLMLYHRHSFLSRYQVAYQEGYVNFESGFLNPLELSSRYGDGGRQEGNPHTWPVTKREVRRDLMPDFDDVQIRVLGTDVPETLNSWFPNFSNRFLSERMNKALARRWGWSLWITGVKPS
jgi:2-polyprenyl-3-methyl-5-hydroxy-6-metoxy-1,4-benzoquinol methylase